MTAVDFLISKLNLNEDAPVCIQAKQMEKQQKIDFATDFARDYIGFSSVCTDVNDLGPAAYYYNEKNKK